MMFPQIGQPFFNALRCSAENADNAAQRSSLKVFRVREQQVQIDTGFLGRAGQHMLPDAFLLKHQPDQHLAFPDLSQLRVFPDQAVHLPQQRGGSHKPLADFRPRIRENVIYISLFHNPAVFHHGHTVRDPLDDRHLMGNQYDGDPKFPVQFLQQRQNGFRRLRIQRAGGFVRKQNRRIRRQGPGNGHPLFLAPGKLGGKNVRLVRQGNQFQQFPDPLLDFFPVPARVLQGIGNIVKNRQPIQQVKLLEDHADASAHRTLFPAGHFSAVNRRLSVPQNDSLPVSDPDFPGIRILQQIEAAHKG